MKYVIGALIAIGLFIGGVLTGRYYYAKETIKVVKETKYETEWKIKHLRPEAEPAFTLENYNTCLTCVNSPIEFGYNLQDNTLLVVGWDECKQNQHEFKIKTVDTKRHIFQLAVIYQYQLDYSIEATYLYNIGIINIGAGVIVNKTNPGVKIAIQKGF